MRSLLLKILGIAVVTVAVTLAVDSCYELGDYPANGDVLVDAKIEATGSIGIARELLRGPLNDRQDLRRGVVLGSDHGSLALDLGRSTPIAALLVQAQTRDDLAVEASQDGIRWERLFEVAPQVRKSGLAVRHHRFEPPVSVRHLRVRNLQPFGFARLGAVRAYSTIPPGWPDRVEQEAPPPSGLRSLLAERLDPGQTFVARLVVACLGAGLLILVHLLQRRRANSRLFRIARFGLVATSALAFLSWWNLLQPSERSGEDLVNTSDVYVYFLGAKYPENGYDNLYHCTIVADDEAGLGGLQLLTPRMRELRTDQLTSRLGAMANPERCKRRFTAERWSAFQRDLDWFRENTRPDYWLQLLIDHGFNASPAFSIVAGPLARLRAATDGWMSALVSLDTLLYVAMWAVVWSTFGWQATCAAMLFWGTSYVAGSSFTIGAFLRSDWIVLSVVGVCCLARKRFVLAGFLLVFATLLRVFPGFLLGGVALAALVEMARLRTWRIPRAATRVAIGAVAGLLLLVPLSMAATNGASTWKTFVKNTIKHKETGASQDIALATSLSYFDFPCLNGFQRMAQFAKPGTIPRVDHRLRDVVVAAVSLALLALALAREEPWVAAILGMAWLPFVAGVSNYYYSFGLLFGLLAVRRPAVIYLFAPLVALDALQGLWFGYLNYDLYMVGSALFVSFFAGVLLLFAWDTGRAALRARRAESATLPAAAPTGREALGR